MNWLRSLERKISRYAIPHIINYIVAGQIFVFCVMFFISTDIYSNILLVRAAVLQGQVWRLITFVFAPANTDILWFAISAYFYYFIGNMLEYAFGTARLNLYVLFGVLGAIASAMLFGWADNSALTLSLFLAYAMLYPEREVLLFFVLPVKVKWLGWLSGAAWLLLFLQSSITGKASLLLGMAGFFVFFGKDFWNAAKAKLRRERWRYKNRNQRW